ncbi:MAG TPA: branched-chain amino acid ABC transporter permease [Lachnospiraceae bacterium]|nr:branched-chain amino acid ABC transporter permease [Lachnospiraceae bacterium]
MLSMLYQFFDSFSFLVLSAMGLAIIFGMMGIINLAHGEFMMMGAYITTLLATAGVPLPIAILCATVGVGIWGFVLDRLVMKHLYERTLDSVVATYGISMIMQQGTQLIFGSALPGVSTPFSSIVIGEDKFSIYRILLFVISLILLLTVYLFFNKTTFGLHARATMQKEDIAASLGINSNKMYAFTFAIGSALAGLAGGLYAPTMTISPTFGDNFMMQSFVTVIVGGTNPLTGTLLSGGLLGAVNSFVSAYFGTFMGRISLLIVAIIFIRICSSGFSGLMDKFKMRRGKI